MNTLLNPHPAGEQLHTDFEVVSSVQFSAERTEAMVALLGRTGCLGDALTYYQGIDPAHEVDNAYFNELSITEQLGEMYNRTVAGLHAAELLVGSVVNPGMYDRRDSRRVRMLAKDATWYQVLSQKSRKMKTPYDTIGEALDSVSEKALTTADANTLSMSAEMLSSALTWWQIAKIKMYKNDKEEYVNDGALRAVLDDSERAMIVSTIAVQDMIKQKMIDEPLAGIEPEERLTRAALGLKAQWRSGAALTNPIFRSVLPEQVFERLNGMVESIQKEFVDGDLLDAKKYPKNETKGLLHELLWLIDAQMVMNADPNNYKTIHVGPSAARLDRPMIGRPTYRRGIDYAIADSSADDGKTQLINLKSGNGDSKEYHPRVKLIKERNFQDNNPGRLANKLRLYKAVIESGFSLPNTAEIVGKYALESVKQELAQHKNPSPSESWPYIPQ